MLPVKRLWRERQSEFRSNVFGPKEASCVQTDQVIEQIRAALDA